MVVFGVEVEDNSVSKAFFKKAKLNLELKDFIRNPYKGAIYRYKGGLYVVDMEPLYPNMVPIGLMAVIGTLIFTGFQVTWWLAPGVFFCLPGLLRTRLYVFIMLGVGLRFKAKYRGKLRLLGDPETLRRVVRHGSN